MCQIAALIEAKHNVHSTRTGMHVITLITQNLFKLDPFLHNYRRAPDAWECSGFSFMPYRWQKLLCTQLVVSVLCNVTDPRQSLVTALLYDLQVAYLDGANQCYRYKYHSNIYYIKLILLIMQNLLGTQLGRQLR